MHCGRYFKVSNNSFLGVPLLRIIVYWGSFFGPLFVDIFHLEQKVTKASSVARSSAMLVSTLSMHCFLAATSSVVILLIPRTNYDCCFLTCICTITTTIMTTSIPVITIIVNFVQQSFQVSLLERARRSYSTFQIQLFVLLSLPPKPHGFHRVLRTCLHLGHASRHLALWP